MFRKFKELSGLVNSVNFEVGENFSFGGLSYLLFPCESNVEERENGILGYIQPSQRANWDIYINTDLVSEKFLKPLLFHEILETDRYALFVDRVDCDKSAWIMAHGVASIYDEKFAKNNLSSSDFLEYGALKDRIKKGKLKF